MKTKEPKIKADAPLLCFECESGILEPVVEDFAIHHPQLGEVRVPDVSLLRCNQCGCSVLGDSGNAHIDHWLDRKLRAISPEEIRRFLRKYSLTQREASQITGLGEKNLCRWLGGRSRASESVSNLLRLLLADEAAFERLRRRDFDESSEPTTPTKKRLQKETPLTH